MDILFRQKPSEDLTVPSVLEAFGIRQCYFKRIYLEKDRRYVTGKEHSHATIEIHAIEEGKQIYEIASKTVILESGSFMVIQPRVQHRVLKEDSSAVRSTVVFEVDEKSAVKQFFDRFGDYTVGCFTKQAIEDLVFICDEKSRKQPFSYTVIESRILEFIFLIIRSLNTAEGDIAFSEGCEDATVSLAGNYVRQNVRRAVTVSELSRYCYMSEKQLNRIFKRKKNCTASEYIRNIRCAEIERILGKSELSLREVSEYMGFANEFYFNSYFKKHSGMTPGAYRKSIIK